MSTLVHHNFISTGVASKLSGYNPDYLSRLCRAGSLTAERAGRAWTIEQGSLENFIERQKERKVELAAQISKQREEEYRQAARERGEDLQIGASEDAFDSGVLVSSPVPATVQVFSFVQAPFRIIAQATSVSVLRVPYLATGITALALSGGVLLAGSGVLERAGAAGLELALTARESVIQNASTLHSSAQQHRDALLAHAVSAPQVFAEAAPITHRSLSVIPDDVARGLQRATPEISLTRDVYHTARVALASYPEPVGVHEVYATVVPFTDPVHIRATVLVAHAQTGQFLYDQGEALGAWYLGFLTASGENLLVLGEKIRDEGRYIGQESMHLATTFSDQVIETHSKLVYGYVTVAQKIPALIFATLYTIGDKAGIYIATGIQTAPIVVEESARFAVAGLEEMTSGLYEGGFALGQHIRQYDTRMTASAFSFSAGKAPEVTPSPLTNESLWAALHTAQ